MSGRIRAFFARGLSCVLLVGIVYSATFNAVHSHSITSTGLAQNISHNLTGQVGVVSDVPLQGRTDGQECLICVLHRQFSHGTVHTPSLIVGTFAHTGSLSLPADFYYLNRSLSCPIARHSGRAPPLFLA